MDDQVNADACGDNRRQEGRFFHEFAKALRANADRAHAPGGQEGHGGQREAQSQAECRHEGHAEPGLMEAKAGNEDDDGRRAGRQARAQAEQRNLGRGNGVAGEFLRDVPHVMAGVFILFLFENRRQGVAGPRAGGNRRVDVVVTVVIRVLVSMIVWMRVMMAMVVVKLMRMFMIVDMIVLVAVIAMVMMSMIVVVMMVTVGAVESPQHPVGQDENNDAGKEIQVGRELRSRPQHASVRRGPRQQPDHGGMGKGGADCEDDRLKIGAACPDHESRHDALRVTRLQAVKSSQQQRRCQEKPWMRAGVLGKVDRVHGRAYFNMRMAKRVPSQDSMAHGSDLARSFRVTVAFLVAGGLIVSLALLETLQRD